MEDKIMKTNRLFTILFSAVISAIVSFWLAPSAAAQTVWSQYLDTPPSGSEQIEWNASSYVLTATGSEEAGIMGTIENEIRSSLASAGIGWMSLQYIENPASDTYEMHFSVASNTTGHVRSVLFGGTFRVNQLYQGYGSGPALVDGDGHTYTVFPGETVSIRLKDLIPGDTYTLYNASGIAIGSFVAIGATHDYRSTFDEGEYHFNFDNSDFSIEYHDFLSYRFVTLAGSYDLSADGGVFRYPITGYFSGNTYHPISSVGDISFLNALSSFLNSGQSSLWDSAMTVSFGYDGASASAYVEICCQPNFGSAERVSHLEIKRLNGREIVFSQSPGGRLLMVETVHDFSLGIATVRDSQPGVAYTASDGNGSASATGNGGDLVLDISSLSLPFSVRGSCLGREICLLIVRPENDIPSPEGAVEALGANRILSRTHNDSGVTADDIEYYDGLGCRKLSVLAGAGGGGGRNDIVQPFRRDFLSREYRDYLPYARLRGIGDSLYVSAPFSAQAAYYRATRSLPAGEEFAYETSFFENATAGRVLKESLPGEDYHHTAHSTRFSYRGNVEDEIPLLRVNRSECSMTVDGYYSPGTLLCTETTDGDGRVSELWTDLSGRTVCEKRFLDSLRTSAAVTSYAYDRLGRLRWAVSPEGSALLGQGTTYAATSDLASRWCFLYFNDSRGRLTEKRLPGPVAEKYVYDNADRLVLVQSPLMTTSSSYAIGIYYDAHGRETGRKRVNLLSKTIEEIRSSFESSGTHSYYTRANNPVWKETAYDAYPSWMPEELEFVREEGFPAADTLRTGGLVTAVGQVVLGDGGYSYASMYYDSLGRVVQKVEMLPSGTLRTSSAFDRQGNILREKATFAADSLSHVLERTFSYDQRGRLLEECAYLDGARMSSVESAYDGLGRVIGLSYREDIEENEYTVHNYLSYNLQGWMNGCSAGYENDFFLSRLHFDDPLPGDAPSYTGNVSSWWTWHDSGEDYGDNEFGFTYDRLGRLTATRSVKGGEQDLFGEDLSYDLNGNITSLTRREGSSEGTTKTWTYTGNRRSAHSYDSAGNIRSGGMPGVTSITYNILGLPSSVTLNGISGHTVEYAWLLDGTKTSAVEREKITIPPVIPPMPLSTGETAEVKASIPADLEPIMMRRKGYVYAGPFRFYVNDYDSTFVLESVAISEGRIVRKELSEGSFVYEPHFFIKDHLGSVRAVVKADGEILQQNDYQPYGEKIIDSDHLSGENDYLYGGKEFQSFFDLPFYDSGARFQRTDGIFLSIDPLAEKYYGISPYAYCSGNPINRVDPEGMIDRKMLIKGGEAIASGAGSLIGASLLTAGTSGGAAPFVGFLVVEGASSLGIGVAFVITGLMTDPSDSNDFVTENIPTSGTNALSKAADVIAGNEYHEIEDVTSLATSLVGLKTGISLTTPKNALGTILTVGQIGLSTYNLIEDMNDKNSRNTGNVNPASSEKKGEQKNIATYEIPEIYYPYWENK